MLAEIAACVAHKSRTEPGVDSLAKEQGFRHAAQFVPITTGATTGEASRLAKVRGPSHDEGREGFRLSNRLR